MSTMTFPRRIRPASAVTLALTALLIVAACGCARTPSGVTSTATGTQLIVTVNFNGPVLANPNYYYFVFFNPVSVASQTPGPIPVVASPWGNSIYANPPAGAITAFMQFNQSFQGQTNNGYAMYAVNQASPLQYSPLPAPIQVYIPGPTGTQLQFQIPLSEIPTTVAGATNLQINFMATDNINMLTVNQNGGGTRNLGVLGTGNQWITIPTTVSTIISSSNTPTEPTGQVYVDYPTGTLTGTNLPSLQITSWSVQVLPS